MSLAVCYYLPVSVTACAADDGDGLDFIKFGRSGTSGYQKTEKYSENVLTIDK